MSRTPLPLPLPIRASRRRLRAGQRIGKYRIEAWISSGGFAAVYRGYDTIEGIRVAIKVPHRDTMTREVLEGLVREVRLAIKLEHPAILPVRNATVEEEQLLIVYPLGLESLEDRIRRRLSARRALEYADQILAGLAHAHQHRVIHCDVKPGNLILFPGDRLKLSDFGIAKTALRTRASGGGTGTIGYVAPEQALGRPSLRSDVFSAGLVIYRLCSGKLPTWPYAWPMPGLDRLKRTYHPELIALLRKSLEVNERLRFRDCVQMRNAYMRIRRRALR